MQHEVLHEVYAHSRVCYRITQYEVPYGLYARSRSATELYNMRCHIEYVHVAIAATGIFTCSKDCYVGYATRCVAWGIGT